MLRSLVGPECADAQQASKLEISVEPTIIARAQSEVPLQIRVHPVEAVPKSFISLRGLPPEISLTEGHVVAAGSWAVSLAELGALKANIPAGLSGRTDITISLIAMDGRLLAQTRTTLVVDPGATGRPREGVPAERVDSRPSSVAAPGGAASGEDGKIPVGGPPPKRLSEEEKARAERALAQGEQYLARGSILVARQYFQRAADAGLAPAALRLAATYDPLELERLPVSGVLSDRDMARRWYERARELGSRDADERLARLKDK